MTTSNSRDFNLDAADIIEEAYELIGLELRTGYDLQRARRSLNLMLKEWGNRGINLWTVSEEQIPLYSGQIEVELPEGTIDVVDAVIRYSGQDYPMQRIVRSDYVNLPDKDQTGRPNQIYVDRQREPVAMLWPAPPDTDYTLIAYCILDIQDVDSPTDTIDVPTLFLPAMAAGLAFYLAMKLAPERVELAKIHYDELLGLAISENTERGSLFLVPGRSC